MKKYFLPILCIIMCILLIACLVQISDLDRQVSYLESRIANQISSLESSVGGISYSIQRAIEEEANLLSSSDWTFGEADMDAFEVELICTVVPKEYSPEKTEAFIVCNDKEYLMTLKDGRYTLSQTVPILDETVISQVLFREDGKVRTESLDWSIYPQNDFLPFVYAHYSGSSRSTRQDNTMVYSMEGNIDISIDCGVPFEIKSIDVVEILNDKEVGRYPVDLSSSGQQSYAAQSLASGQNLVMPADSSFSYQKEGRYTYYLDKEYTFRAEDDFELWVEVRDGYDLTYKVLIESIRILTENGHLDLVTPEVPYFHEAIIFDKKGKLVYDPFGDSGLYW